ncbi:MAG: PAS sensor protein [Desulfobulbus sp.]|nr:MAG: PAS sensor protein [Desulfobulbus sp.]
MTKAGQQARERRFLKVYQKVTRLISMVMDHQQVMDAIVRMMPEELDVDACTIRLLDSSTNSFVLGAANGLSKEYLSRESIDTVETMEMIKSGFPVAKVDLDEDPTYADREAASIEGIKSVLTLPILFQDSIIGIMRMLTRNNRVFTSGEISFSMALAEQVGLAISNSRMFMEMENQVNFMNEVQTISKLVNSTLDLDEILQTIVKRLPASLQAKGCTIRLVKPQTNYLELVAANGLSETYLQRGKIEKEKNVVMVLSGEPVTIFDVATDDRVRYKKDMQEEGIKSLLALPIKVSGEVIGVLRILYSESRSFSSSEVNFALTVAEASGSAIQNARTYTKITLLFNQIEENERFLTDILDCIRPQLIVLDRSKHIVLANRVFLENIDKPEADVLGMEYYDVCPIEQGDEVCPADAVLKDGEPASFTHSQEIDGEQHWIERTAYPMFDKNEKVEYIIEIIRDVTAKKQYEGEQIERVKLQGVVDLAGTVAHEINSPLFAALGAAQLMEDDLVEEEQIQDVQMIIRNLKNISELTGKMTSMTGFEGKEYVGDAKIVEFK